MAILVERVGTVVQSARRTPRSTREPPWTHWEPGTADEPSLVRPYTLTAGRTDPRVDLPLEAPIQTLHVGAAAALAAAATCGARSSTLCADSPSVAEIAARLVLPLGVARVLSATW